MVTPIVQTSFPTKKQVSGFERHVRARPEGSAGVHLHPAASVPCLMALRGSVDLYPWSLGGQKTRNVR